MRRMLGLLFAIVAVIGMGGSGIIAAQDATPPSVIDIAPGVTADQVVIFEGRQAPSLYRLHFTPGTSYTVEPSEQLELVYIEAGTMSLTLDAPFIVGVAADPGSAPTTIEANTETTLTAGQYVVLAPSVGGTVRNTGQDELVISVAGVLPGQATATPGA